MPASVGDFHSSQLKEDLLTKIFPLIINNTASAAGGQTLDETLLPWTPPAEHPPHPHQAPHFHMSSGPFCLRL